MASGGGSQQSLRKAIGAIKDSTKVGLANLNSENKELDIAIVKATNHHELLPKEKHVRSIFCAVSASSPRPDVIYCIHGLAKRLAKTHTWTVALKVLIVIHRALRDVGPPFRQALIDYSQGRGLMLNLSHFRDDSSRKAWDCSAWVRAYALYLEERLECFRKLKYDVEKDKPRTRVIDTPDLLGQLPILQSLLQRLLACRPVGVAASNALIHYPLSIVAGESIRLYVAIADGILNLVDKYFEMQRHDAIRALELYRKFANQAEEVSEFFQICRALAYGREQKFVKIQKAPASFITTMEEYVKDAPQTLYLEYTPLNDNQGVTSNQMATPKVTATPEANLIDYEQDVNAQKESVNLPDPQKSEQSTTPNIPDLLCMDELTETASEMDDKNPLALAIVPSENSSNSGNGHDGTHQSSNWELALFEAPSSNVSAVEESKLAGGLDKLTLDSLYAAAMARAPNQNESCNKGPVSSNPFDDDYCNQDPFYAYSIEAAPPGSLPIPDMAQQQAFIMQWQQQLQHHQQPPLPTQHSNNPFDDPIVEQRVPSQSHPPQNSQPGLI